MSVSKSAGQLAASSAIGDADREFVVQLERTIAEVGRADDAEHAVDDHRLGVHHGRLVFEHLDALSSSR